MRTSAARVLALFLLAAAVVLARDETVACPTQTVDMSSVGDLSRHEVDLTDGKTTIAIYPIDAFGKVACAPWSGRPEGREEMINRNCVIGWAQELAQPEYSVPNVRVFVSATPIHNCFATKTVVGDRIIVMDPFFIREYVDITCDCLYIKHKAKYPGLEPDEGRWWFSGSKARRSDEDTHVMRGIVVKSILWHEWAHAQLGHIDDPARTKEEQAVRESDADATAAYWIGWHFGKDGAPKAWMPAEMEREMMVEVFSTLGELDDTDHPCVMTRMTTARDAFDAGLGDGTHRVENPPSPSRREQARPLQDDDDLYDFYGR